MKNNSKQIYLKTGTVKGWQWRLSFTVSVNQRSWSGSFDFCELTKCHTQKTVYLVGGGEDGLDWQLNLNVSVKEPLNWCGNFYVKESRQNEKTSTKG
jgi:hypothetical protein